MASSSLGPDGEPEFADGDAPDVAVNPSEVAKYAAKRGTRPIGTTAQRNAYAYPKYGLQWFDTTLGREFIFLTEGWTRSSYARGGIVETNIASNGSTSIPHGLGAVPDFVTITPASHSSSDSNTQNWRVVLWGSPSSTVFNVRVVDNRTNGYLSGSVSARFSWAAGVN